MNSSVAAAALAIVSIVLALGAIYSGESDWARCREALDCQKTLPTRADEPGPVQRAFLHLASSPPEAASQGRSHASRGSAR